jgi:hypothetical protein
MLKNKQVVFDNLFFGDTKHPAGRELAATSAAGRGCIPSKASAGCTRPLLDKARSGEFRSYLPDSAQMSWLSIHKREFLADELDTAHDRRPIAVIFNNQFGKAIRIGLHA